MERKPSSKGILSVEEALRELGVSSKGSIFVASQEDVRGVSIKNGSWDYSKSGQEFFVSGNVAKPLTQPTSYI
jgi:hypothetical protein